MINREVFNVPARAPFTFGLFAVRQRLGMTFEQLLASHRRAVARRPSTGAVAYWASLPRLELPETGLSPHYLEDFILHPPTGAA